MGTIELLSQLSGFATTKGEKKLSLPSRKVGGHGKIHALIQQKPSKKANLAHCQEGQPCALPPRLNCLQLVWLNHPSNMGRETAVAVHLDRRALGLQRDRQTLVQEILPRDPTQCIFAPMIATLGPRDTQKWCQRSSRQVDFLP